MAKVMKPSRAVFPPSDRELALRAQIKTGWSTIPSNISQRNAGLSPSELKQIQQVLERAQAVERSEEVRVGLQILKHKQMVEMCRGNGVTTCRICNKNLSSKRSSRPEPIQLCNDCQQVICTRCKIQSKTAAGNPIVLCTVCYEERELWKKSGSWLSNSKPSVSIPMENLEEIQQQISKSRSRLSGRHNDATPGFVSPYQLEVEDQDDDDDNMSPPTSRLNYTPSLSERRPSPTTDLLKELKAASEKLDFDISPVVSATNLSDSDDSNTTTHSDAQGGRMFSRKSGLSRRSAITKVNKDRLMESRERARSRSRSGSRVPAPSLTSSPAFGARSDDESGIRPRTQTVTGSVPAIKVRKPSTMSPEGTQSLHREVQSHAESAEDSESESGRNYAIRQMHKHPSTDSDVMVVEGGLGAAGIDVAESIKPAMAAAFQKQRFGSPSGSTSSASSDVPQSQFDDLQPRSSPAASEEFKKVGAPADLDGFKKVEIGQKQPVKEVSNASASLLMDDDLFKKVGGPAKTSHSVDERAKVSPPKDSADFSKVDILPKREPEWKRVRGGSLEKPQSVKTTTAKASSLPRSRDSDEFKMVSSKAFGSTPKASTPPRDSDHDEFKRSSKATTPPRNALTAASKASTPPRNADENAGIFKKVSTASLPAFPSPSKVRTPPRNVVPGTDEFKKTPTATSPVRNTDVMDEFKKASTTAPTAGSPLRKADAMNESTAGSPLRKADVVDKFKKTSTAGSPLRKADVVDEFKKTSTAGSPLRKADVVDEFKKTSTAGSPLRKADVVDEFKKTSSPVKNVDVEDEFKKTSTAPTAGSPLRKVDVVGKTSTASSPVKNADVMSEFKKTSTAPTASSPLRTADVADEFKRTAMKPSSLPRNADSIKTTSPAGTLPGSTNDEFKIVPVARPRAEVKSSVPAPTEHTPKPPKPVAAARKRVLPTTSQEDKPAPTLHSDSAEIKEETMKQSSFTPAAGEHVDTSSPDSTSTTSKESLPLDDSNSLTKSAPEAILGHESRGFARRNAQRVTQRPKRPQLRPRPNTEDAVSDQEKTADPAVADEEPPRMRSRSGAIRRSGRRAVRGELTSPSTSPHRPAAEDHTLLSNKGLADSWEEQSPSRLRGSSLNTEDRNLARRARVTRKEDRNPIPTKYRVDGNFGSIRISLAYNPAQEELVVTIHSCKGLRAMDKSGLSDPYVKLFLQPRNKFQQQFRTKTVFKELNPVFEEAFVFTGLPEELIEKKKLCAVVMDQDELSKDDLIGGTQVNLYEILNSETREICIKRLLDDRSVSKKELVATERGMVHLKLRYSAATEELIVSVLGTRDLDSRIQNGLYLKCIWKSRVHSAKVKTKLFTSQQFSEDLCISAAVRDLTYSSLVVGVWEHRHLKDKQLGEVQFKSISFWKSFSLHPSKVVQDWYPLTAPVATMSRTETLPRLL